jgi:hypothetical protein
VIARLAATALLGVALLAAAPLATATPRTSVNAIESEVMCPVCGTLLELAESPQAQREKAFVARLVAAGRSKDQMNDALGVLRWRRAGDRNDSDGPPTQGPSEADSERLDADLARYDL